MKLLKMLQNKFKKSNINLVRIAYFGFIKLMNELPDGKSKNMNIKNEKNIFQIFKPCLSF